MRRLHAFLLRATLALVVATGARAQEGPARKFVYVGDADLAPFDYLDASGRPTGFSVDLIRALARDAGVEVEIRLGEWNRVRADFDAGTADVISLSYSEERGRTYLWLARTWTVHQSLLFRTRNQPYPAGLENLSKESIAVQERSLVAERLRALPPPQPIIVTTASQAETLRLLQDGAVTAVGGGSLVLRVAAAGLGMRDFVELPLGAVPYGFVATKGRGEELSWVPSSMAHLRDAGTLEALAEKYLVNPTPPRSWWEYRLWLLSLVGILTAAGAAAWAWNRSLLFRVRERTRDMEQALRRGETLMRSLTANEARFQTFMTLSSEGIARVELDEPLPVNRPEGEQVEHIFRAARLVESNEAFARMLKRSGPPELMGSRLRDLVTEDELTEGLQAFIRGGYRLAERERARAKRSGELRWVSSNAVGVVEGEQLKAIWFTQSDITRRKEIEANLRVRGRILEAVAFSSARLLEPGPWKEHVAEILERLGEAVGVGCAYIFENLLDRDGATRSRIIHEWSAPGVPGLTHEPTFQNLAWPDESLLRKDLAEGKTVTRLLQELPPRGRELLAPLGLKSFLVVPIFVEGRWWGFLGFGDFKNERKWSAAETEGLKTAGVSLGAALLREQAEEAVRASEKKHRDIVEFAPAGIYQSSREGRLIMANLEFARLLGAERIEDVIGLNFARDVYFDPADRERLIARYEAEGHAGQREVRLKRRDGRPFWAAMSAHAVKDHAGQTLYFEGFIQDMSQGKTAEDELRASEVRYRLLFDFNPLPMLVYDLETLAILAANEAAVVQYGYSRPELLAITIERLASPLDLDFPAILARRFEPQPELGRLGVRPQLRKDGTTIEVDITRLSLSFGGRPARLLLNRDVTAERRAEAERERLGVALERAADEWHRTFDAVGVAILVLDREERLTRVNRPAITMLGLDYIHVLGRRITDLDSQEPWAMGAEIVRSVVRTREAVSARAAGGGGARTWELTAYLAEAGQGGEERVILVVRDISHLVALQESLRRSETVSAMGSLVAGVAHEVRNPLFSISATVDALESELGDKKEYAELTELLRSQVGRLRQLMRDLLDYGKPPALRVASVHAREVMRRAVRACAGLAREREVRLLEDMPEDLPPLSLDGSRMEQVFQNLLANAVQHSPRAGTVRAIARLGPEKDPSVEFVVEDEGAGLAPAEIPQLFEPFFSRRKGGTGLGLSVVQRIVEAHGGRVTASNREGGGAVFTVRLPPGVIDRSEEFDG